MSSLTTTPTSSPVKPPAPHNTPLKAKEMVQGVKSGRTNRKLSSLLESRGFGKSHDSITQLRMVKLHQNPQLNVPIAQIPGAQISLGGRKYSPLKQRRLSESTSYKICEFARVNADNFSRKKSIDFSESKMNVNTRAGNGVTKQEEARYQEMLHKDLRLFQASGGEILQDNHGGKHKITNKKAYKKGSKQRLQLQRSTKGKKAAAKFFPEEDYNALFAIAKKRFDGFHGYNTILDRPIGWSQGQETSEIQYYFNGATGKAHIRPF